MSEAREMMQRCEMFQIMTMWNVRNSFGEHRMSINVNNQNAANQERENDTLFRAAVF